MKIFAFLSLFFLALPVTVNAQEELLKFEHPLIDAGTMTEDDAPRTFTFVGKNVSKKILHITQVRTTCGCTSSYVRGDVMKPGDTCQVQITFTPNRYPGTINTGAYLYLKEVEGQPAVKLALTGKVLPGADQWARYPHKMGALRLKQAKASITEVKPGTEPEARILCGNSGDKPLRISSLLLPPYARLTTEPEVIEPGDEADLVITIIADKIPATMPESFTFPVILEGLDARPSDRTIQVVVKVKGKKEKVKRKNTKTMKYLKNSSPSWWLLCLPAALLPAAAMMKNRRSLLWKLHLPIFMAHGSWLSGTVNLLLRAHTATSFSIARTRLSRCIRSLTVCMVAISPVRSLSRTIHTRATSSAVAMITVRATGTRVIS